MSHGPSQARYWIGTLPFDEYNLAPTREEFWLRKGVKYVIGQQERGESGYHHYQVVVTLSRKQRLSFLTKYWPKSHWEPTYAKAANEYVQKEDTRIPDSQFVFGTKPFHCNQKTDWSAVRSQAIAGHWNRIEDHVFIRCYHQLRRIWADASQAKPMERVCEVYWGPTSLGKSRLAWESAGNCAYSKDPRTKWWCGYQGEENIVIDEFRGDIDISHMLRWLDRYPVRLETKGSSVPHNGRRFWITSNIHPDQWYPEIDTETKNALLRRLRIIKFSDDTYDKLSRGELVEVN